jgi:sterol desaturase/sphingolipid hydroxylase (fatty acid hydroxylase superfamily)
MTAITQVPEWIPMTQWISERGFLLILTVFVAMVLLERLYYAIKLPKQYPDLDALSSFGTGLINRGLRVIIDYFLLFTIYIWVYNNLSLFDLSNSIWGFVVGLVLHDFAWYWQHRIRHRVSFFWAEHLVHHSSNTFTFPVAQRACFTGRILRSPAFAIAAIAGVSPEQFAVVTVITFIWGIVSHSDTIPKLGWLEGVMVTPSMHRVHHGTQAEYIDKNYGEFFAIWDRMFGTYQEEIEKVNFGLVTSLKSLNPIVVQFSGYGWLWHRWNASKNWMDKIIYMVAPPEWQHKENEQGR